jgi:hypothetical protein
MIERAQRLKLAVEETQKRAADLGQIQTLRTAAEKLSEQQAQLSFLNSWRLTLQARGETLAAPGTASATAYTAVRAYREELESAGRGAVEPVAITQLLNQLRGVVGAWRALLSTAWSSYVTNHAPALNRAVLRVLRDIQSLRKNAASLERCLEKVDGWKENLPSELGAIADFDQAVQEAREIWHRLGGDDLDPEIARFLQESATAEAPLERLTPDVETWLRNHGIWGAFRITISRDTATASRQ